MEKLFRINPKDNVAVALGDLRPDEQILIGGEPFKVLEPIKAGHKAALSDIRLGEPVIKYGNVIGSATAPIKVGQWVHSHNMASGLKGAVGYRYDPVPIKAEKRDPVPFRGYRRADGRVGIRNEIWIIPTVGCVNGVVRKIEEASQSFLSPSIDGIHGFSHSYGCSQLGEDLERFQDLLCGLIKHPNAGGVLVVGLGCENNRIEQLRSRLGSFDESRVKFLECQKASDEIAEGISLVEQLSEQASKDVRTACLSSDLVIGLKCGGSDGFSGITANPLVGMAADRLAAEGGTAVLTEVPEMFGAEHLLMRRCRDEATFNDLVRLIDDFKDYYLGYGQKINENPSPGNKDGGITTLEEKSLGCIQKGGSSPIQEIYRYAQPITAKGLCILEAPGNDLVSTYALAASGAVMTLFTTGRGTPFNSPVPTLKIATNLSLAERKSRWIDFNAGKVLENGNMAEIGSQLYELIISCASGSSHCKSETFDKGEVSFFKNGVIL